MILIVAKNYHMIIEMYVSQKLLNMTDLVDL